MLECPECGSDTYPLMVRAVTCSNPDCPRSNVGWIPEEGDDV